MARDINGTVGAIQECEQIIAGLKDGDGDAVVAGAVILHAIAEGANASEMRYFIEKLVEFYETRLAALRGESEADHAGD